MEDADDNNWKRLGTLANGLAARLVAARDKILVEGRESNAPAFAATKPCPQEISGARGAQQPIEEKDRARVEQGAARFPDKKGSGSKGGPTLGKPARGAKAVGSRPGDTRTTVVRGAAARRLTCSDEIYAGRRRKIEIEMSGLDPRRPGHTAAGLQCGTALPAADLHSAFHSSDVG